MQHENFMRKALQEAKKAYAKDEVPVGAIIVKDGRVVARSHNHKEKKQCVIAHAEIEAIQKASKHLGSWHLDDCDVYVTLEPCAMCAGALLHARVKHIYYGADDPKGGALGSNLHLYEVKGLNHYPSVTKGILSIECSEILRLYFQAKRDKKRIDTKS